MADSQDTALEGAIEIEAPVVAKVDNDQGNESSAEDKARLRGWKPEDEFSGPKDKWVSADEFLKRGEDEPALLKANLKRLEQKLEQQAKTIKEFATFATKAEERAYQRAVADLKTRRIEAVAAGDTAAVEALSDEMTELVVAAKTAPGASEPDVVDDFISRNPWYTDPDPEKEDAQIWAQGLSNKLAAEGKTPKQQLAEVEKRVKTKFPALFENPRRNEPGAVEGRQPMPRKMVKSFENLPREAQEACDKFIRSGLIKDRAAYVKDYDFS